MYNFKSKDIAINEMKEISDDVSKYGNILYIIPENSNNNTSFINKIKEIFNIGITYYERTGQGVGTGQEQVVGAGQGQGQRVGEKDGNKFIIYANFDFKLGIPLYYNPEIINYKDSNFIKMNNVVLSYQYIPQEDIGCIEILLHTYKLGFIFNKSTTSNIGTESTESAKRVMMQDKDYSIMSTTLLIPNISTNIKDCYYNINKLSNVHLGELINGLMLIPNIFLNTSLEIDIIPIEKISNSNSNGNIKKVVSKTVINFNSYYYYIKNDKNNVIYCGIHKKM
jgi:hypothetical protein